MKYKISHSAFACRGQPVFTDGNPVRAEPVGGPAGEIERGGLGAAAGGLVCLLA